MLFHYRLAGLVSAIVLFLGLSLAHGTASEDAVTTGTLFEGLPEINVFPRLSPMEAAPREIGDDPPSDGLRHWDRPFYRMPLFGCYITLLNRGSENRPLWEWWENSWGDEAADRGLVRIRGTSLAGLGEREKVCTGEIISDVYIPAGSGRIEIKQPPELAPLRGFTRPHFLFDDEIGYVAMACVCPDYQPGSVSLMPAILSSSTGDKGTWRYHGMLDGEPREEERKSGRPIWSDGGTILRMKDGSWRIYLNNFGKAAISLLTSRTLEGPWKFLRDEDGEIRDLLPPDSTGKTRENCFPHVLRVSDDEWHLWISDQWPVHAIRHFQSRDGITWIPYGKQPEITRAAVGGRAIKCIRTCVSPDGRTIWGFLSVWESEKDGGKWGWRSYMLTMPAGLLAANDKE